MDVGGVCTTDVLLAPSRRTPSISEDDARAFLIQFCPFLVREKLSVGEPGRSLQRNLIDGGPYTLQVRLTPRGGSSRTHLGLGGDVDEATQRTSDRVQRQLRENAHDRDRYHYTS